MQERQRQRLAGGQGGGQREQEIEGAAGAVNNMFLLLRKRRTGVILPVQKIRAEINKAVRPFNCFQSQIHTRVPSCPV